MKQYSLTVEELIKIGRTVLEKQGGDLSSAR